MSSNLSSSLSLTVESSCDDVLKHQPPADQQQDPLQRNDKQQQVDMRVLRRVLMGLYLGGALEFYDFSIFSGLSGPITANFFPSAAIGASLSEIFFWSLFAIGFATRPLGAILFGHIADRYSRRTCLISSILTMAVPTVRAS